MILLLILTIFLLPIPIPSLIPFLFPSPILFLPPHNERYNKDAVQSSIKHSN